MVKNIFSYTSPRRKRWLCILIMLTGFIALSAGGTLASTAGVAFAASRPGGNVADPVVRAVDVAQPAVVRIITTLGGHLTVHFSNTNSVTFPQNNAAYPLGLSGSGTFISAHGDVLTADHVINPPHDQTLDAYLDQTAAPDVATYMNQNARAGAAQVTASQVQQELDAGQLNANRSYDPALSEVYLNTAYTGPLSAPALQSLPGGIHAVVDRIEMQSAVNADDVAIVHVNLNDMPSVALADSSNVQQQDRLTIIGFPGNGDVSTRPTDLLTASVNQITVSSIKTTNAGAPVIQVGGDVEHGDSGGPALDSAGSVVGIVSFELATGSSPGGTSFLQASNSAEGLVRSLNLNTAPGAFQTTWSRALAEYAATTPGHWHRAVQDLQKLAASYPLFKAVDPYLAYARQQASSEQTHQQAPARQSLLTPGALPAYVWISGGAAVVVLLLLFLTGILFSRRRKKASARKTGADQASAAAPIGAQQRVGQMNMPAPPPPQVQRGGGFDKGMSAFGAPGMGPPSGPPSSILSGTLRPWPCGHMNRSNARYCSICGEPAPAPPTQRRIEQ